MENPSNEITVIGFRIDAESEQPNLYALTSTDQEDSTHPVTYEGQIIVFTKLSLAGQALKTAGICNEHLNVYGDEVLWVDVAQALYLIENGSLDKDKVIANLLGTFAEMFNPISIVVPVEYRELLIQLFGYLTFEQDLNDFFKAPGARITAIHGIQWCLGALLSNARILT